MAHWGIAYAAGPNYNLPWDLYDPAGKAKALAASYDAMQRALGCADGATPVEQALIRALPARYPQREPIEDQSGWDKAFTEAMRAVFEAHTRRSRRRARLRRSDHERDAVADVGPHTGGVAEGAGTAEAVEVLEQAFRETPARGTIPACCISMSI